MNQTALELINRINSLEDQVRRLTVRLDALEGGGGTGSKEVTKPTVQGFRKPRGNTLYVQFDMDDQTREEVVQSGIFSHLERAGFRVVNDLSNADYAAFAVITSGRWTGSVDAPRRIAVLQSFNRPSFWILLTWGNSHSHGDLREWPQYTKWPPFYFDYMKRKEFEMGTPTPEKINRTVV